MRYLVLGGAGLLGTHLVPALASAGHEVAIVDNFTGSIQYRTSKDYRIFTADTTDLNRVQHAFSAYIPQVIINAVSCPVSRDTIYNFHEDVKTELLTAAALSAVLSRSIKHVYFCSSYEVYGGPQSRRALKETRKIIESSSHHGVAKYSAEKILSLRCQELRVPFTNFRIFDMFGPRIVYSARTSIVSFFIDFFLRQEQLGLVGATKPRDFIHVEDVVSAMMAIIDSGQEGTFNVGTGEGTSLRELAQEIGKYMPINNLPIELKDGRFPTYSYVANIDKLKDLGWEPTKNVLECIPELIEFRKKEMAFYSRSNPRAILEAMRGINNV